MLDQTLHLLGFAFGLAGADPKSGDGPLYLQAKGLDYPWDTMIMTPPAATTLRVDEAVRAVCLDLATRVSALVRAQQYFSVIGGDHTAAIGTWSGVYDALQAQGDIGLVWIDAHMDSHTPETTESGRVHGMPLACLLGYGYPTLTGVLHAQPKLKPENVCLIGVRSFEQGEEALLQRLNVRVYDMNEINARGMVEVMQEAVARVRAQTVAYGLSIDLDALDPHDAPGVDVPEASGIQADDFYQALISVAADPRLIGTEIMEFDPHRDRDMKTEIIIKRLLAILAKARQHD